jgi:hypothetical protein
MNDIDNKRWEKTIYVNRPKMGKPSIGHAGSATADVQRAVLEHGWTSLDKIVRDLKKLGYLVWRE